MNAPVKEKDVGLEQLKNSKNEGFQRGRQCVCSLFRILTAIGIVITALENKTAAAIGPHLNEANGRWGEAAAAIGPHLNEANGRWGEAAATVLIGIVHSGYPYVSRSAATGPFCQTVGVQTFRQTRRVNPSLF
ncbi:hypothetical protein SUGI_0595980 [Cryptomeria japonica]|nr:hypothetical protein SUGI_0595980 [Cryptomeria japonica]